MIVEARGSESASLMVIGSSPGEWESQTGVVFHPKSAVGKELTRYLNQTLRLDRDDVWLTNLVPEYLEERDIARADIKKYEPELHRQLATVRPRYIMTLGREATQWFLGDVNLEDVYALPHRWKKDPEIIIIPNYLRLYDSELQPVIWYAFEQTRLLMRGDISPHTPETGGAFVYVHATDRNDVQWLGQPQLLAVDTEGLPGKPWGLSFSNQRRRAHVIKVQSRGALNDFHERTGATTIILHNSLYDIAILRDMGITVHKFHDTMVMAFLLCLEPQGLKQLAYRYRGIERESYMEVIGPASTKLALDWLQDVALTEWGPAPEELIFGDDDTVKIRKPWSLNRRLDGILGIRTGEILSLYGDDKKTMTMAKRCLESFGVKVGKYNSTKTGWVDCRVSTLAYRELVNSGSDFLFDFDDPAAADDPRKRWEALCEDMPVQTDAAEQQFGLMPEAGLDALETVFGEEGKKKAIDYSAGDADDTWTIYPILSKRIDEMDLRAAYDLDIAVIPMIDRMMHVGFAADRDYFQEMGRELAIEMERDLDQIESVIHARLNPNSPLQVASLLFDKLKLPVQQYTATKQPSTADEVIEALRLISDHPVLPLISDYRELSKVKGTYADKLWRWLGPDNRIHPKLRITRVPSGRLACSEPNLMAIPVRSQRLLGGEKLGKRVRDGFRARPGCVLGSWDLDQIEMRILAHRSEDSNLLNVFWNKEDIHRKTASLVFDTTMEGVEDWQRSSAKNVGFGIVYGITSKGLQLQMKLRGIDRSEEECQEMIDAYLIKAYPGVRALMETRKAEARRYGFVRSMLGRIRYLPGVHSSNFRLRAEAERVCLNHDIQTSAQEVMKLGMKGVWERVFPAIHSQGYYCEPVLQIHDELILELDADIMDEVDIMIRHEMQEAMQLLIPIGSKGNYAEKWGALK